MSDLVQTFLMLARTQREDPAMTPKATLVGVAEQLISQWRDPIEGKGLKLTYNPPAEGQVSDIRYNATFLHAVMGNLLRNALHYT